MRGTLAVGEPEKVLGAVFTRHQEKEKKVRARLGLQRTPGGVRERTRPEGDQVGAAAVLMGNQRQSREPALTACKLEVPEVLIAAEPTSLVEVGGRKARWHGSAALAEKAPSQSLFIFLFL